MAEYDGTIVEHYASVAESEGLSETSTMADKLIRQRETEAIVSFSKLATGGTGRVADCGCGNGHTLSILAEECPQLELTGFEYTPELRELSAQRFADNSNVSIHPGDIRDADFFGDQPFDAIIVQRVIINLLDVKDQKHALDNLVRAIRPGGHGIFIECFVEPFAELNEAREEFGLEPIGPAHHNLYLEDGFYTRDDLEPFEHEDWSFPPNYLSTHYFVSRAFEPGLTKERPFKRNSMVQRFLSQAFPPAVGNFAPLLINTFRRSA